MLSGISPLLKNPVQDADHTLLRGIRDVYILTLYLSLFLKKILYILNVYFIFEGKTVCGGEAQREEET